ncbi:protein-arginine deiminase type-4 [Pochonia chlamydosporia 170]|uniref:Protein-arginine deiminase type-4 n=1 Tax=Pochonia chlamydosporia 170 TaxID=1380566 RepID=A0A179FBZ6_METCM|nr:protein-arginine deiminase type-4 [Pochonia chlamydosporia 170]OAQ62639.1 protein-arginine deiminase type-4 [Pochonia chlamydosporia 170]
MVDDPRAGLEMLRKAQQAGHGQEMAVSRPKSPTDGPEWRVTNTIDDLLNITNFAGFQESCAKGTEENVNIMKRETGITDAEIIRIPSLYEDYPENSWKYANDKPVAQGKREEPIYDQARAQKPKGLNALEAGTPPRDLKHQPEDAAARSLEGRQEADRGAVTLYPGAINSVVLGNKQIVAPNPWGPIIEGQDVLATAVNAAYAKAGYTVVYVDDWFTHHATLGEVHCGSNVIRELTDVKWW